MRIRDEECADVPGPAAKLIGSYTLHVTLNGNTFDASGSSPGDGLTLLYRAWLDAQIHTEPRAPILAVLSQMHQQLQTQGVLLMAVSPQIAAFSARFDTATNKIAADLEALRLKIAAGGQLSAEDLAILDTSVTRLELMGKDPENPVPEVPPVV